MKLLRLECRNWVRMIRHCNETNYPIQWEFKPKNTTKNEIALMAKLYGGKQ